MYVFLLQLGLNERKALFEQQSAGGAALPRAGSVGTKTANAGRDPKPESTGAGGGAAVSGTDSQVPGIARSMSLKERMALLQGVGGDGSGSGKQAEAPAVQRVSASGKESQAAPPIDSSGTSKPTAQVAGQGDTGAGPAKQGGLQDRMKAFGGAAKPVAQQVVQQKETQASKDTRSQTISERMAALKGGGGAGSEEVSAAAGAGSMMGKSRTSTGSSPDTQIPPVGTVAPVAATAEPAPTMSLKDRLALLQQQENKEAKKTDDAKVGKIDNTQHNNNQSTSDASNRSGQENVSGNSPDNRFRPTSTGDSSGTLPRARSSNNDHPVKAAVSARWEVGVMVSSWGTFSSYLVT